MIHVAGYCRVSTDKEDQANSFASQKRYFSEYIGDNPDWELYEIYADEGISGTSTTKRSQFNRMIQDARRGRFQLILTKEVSRFSRNIVDTLSYTRELKQMGVAVEFMTDRINTMDSDGELRLSILATLAQDESRRTSSRVVWGQTRQMEKGVVFGRSLLGYEVANGRLILEPQGAGIVRLIFRKYAVEQVSTAEIARILTREGYRTGGGSTSWKAGSIVKILKNEKYAGDLVQRKTYTPDYLSHEKRANRGQVPLIRMENHHEPIISRELWNLAQARLRQANKHHAGKEGHSNRYAFSGKIKCGQCGASYVARVRTLKNGEKVRRWSCATAVRQGRAGCSIGKLLRDDDAFHMMHTAFQNIPLDTGAVIGSLTQLAVSAIQWDQSGAGDRPDRLQVALDKLRQKKERVLDAFFAGDISKADMQAMKNRYEQQEADLQRRMEQARDPEENGEASARQTAAIRQTLTAFLSGESGSDILCKFMLKSLTVCQDRHMELRLKDLPLVFRFRE